MSMNVSNSGLTFLKRWERFRAQPYNDGYGNLTIGYGHVILPGEKYTQLTEAEAAALLAKDVAWAESVVNQLVRVPLSQSQFDALVSLTFNWGSGNFTNSSHLALLNAGDYAGTAQRIREHPVTSGGQLSQGLVNRRAAEAELFARDGIYSLDELQTAASAPAPAPAPISESASRTNILPWLVVGGLLVVALAWD